MRIENQQFDEERALYGICDATILNCTFDGPKDGESVLKECKDIVVDRCSFNLRYPFWHVENATIRNCTMTENTRAALWYDESVVIDNCIMKGIKALRECTSVRVVNSEVVSKEFLWRCKDVNVENTMLESEYPMFECKYVTIDKLNMKGKYSFQYVENMTISNSVLDTKDAFWHGKNITVTDSVVKGEYLGWYSENLKFVRCKIIGTQPLCYCKNLVLEDCTMEGCDLSFERSEVHATIKGSVDGIKNPISGRIVADEVGEVLLESNIVDEKNTVFEISNIQSFIRV